jgi:hypothetical protein
VAAHQVAMARRSTIGLIHWRFKLKPNSSRFATVLVEDARGFQNRPKEEEDVRNA